jgi:hypothetical protein
VVSADVTEIFVFKPNTILSNSNQFLKASIYCGRKSLHLHNKKIKCLSAEKKYGSCVRMTWQPQHMAHS